MYQLPQTGLVKAPGLKIVVNKNTAAFYYATKKDKWQLLKEGVDARFLNNKTSGVIVGCMMALYIISSGEITSNKAWFLYFETKSNEDIYQ